MSEKTTRIAINTIDYYKNKKTARELEEVPIDILRCMYLELLHNVEQLEKENKDNKKIISMYIADYCKRCDELRDSIPKSVIRDKIEELEDKLKDVSKRREKAKAKEEENILWCLQIRLDEKTKTLKEILGEE